MFGDEGEPRSVKLASGPSSLQDFSLTAKRNKMRPEDTTQKAVGDVDYCPERL